MTRVSMRCGFCQWTDVQTVDPSRADQTAYMAIWPHVQASHRVESGDLRALSIRERKETLISWATMQTASTVSTTHK